MSESTVTIARLASGPFPLTAADGAATVVTEATRAAATAQAERADADAAARRHADVSRAWVWTLAAVAVAAVLALAAFVVRPDGVRPMSSTPSPRPTALPDQHSGSTEPHVRGAP